MPSFRVIFALFASALTGFSCATFSSIVAKPIPYHTGPMTPAILASQFAELESVLDKWASSENYEKRNCPEAKVTPFCKVFSNFKLEIQLELRASSNSFRILVIDRRGTVGVTEVTRSLEAALKPLPTWNLCLPRDGCY